MSSLRIGMASAHRCSLIRRLASCCSIEAGFIFLCCRNPNGTNGYCLVSSWIKQLFMVLVKPSEGIRLTRIQTCESKGSRPIGIQLDRRREAVAGFNDKEAGNANPCRSNARDLIPPNHGPPAPTVANPLVSKFYCDTAAQAETNRENRNAHKGNKRHPSSTVQGRTIAEVFRVVSNVAIANRRSKKRCRKEFENAQW